MSDTIYIPPNCQRLSDTIQSPQIRLAIQGFGGTGKTHSALTFPNPIVLNLDRGLGAHAGREDVIEVPFYNGKFCKNQSEIKDKLLQWMETEAKKLTAEQTLVIDSNTQVQNAYHAWYNDNRMNFVTDKGKEDGFAEWKIKKQYFGELLESLKGLQCNVIYICHETEASIGKHSGKLRPLLTGQFCDELLTYFTDFVRQQVTDKPKDGSVIEPEALRQWNMTREQFKDVCSEYPRGSIYYWQLESDSIFDGKCSSLVNYPRFIPANFEYFNKYRRQISTKV